MNNHTGVEVEVEASLAAVAQARGRVLAPAVTIALGLYMVLLPLYGIPQPVAARLTSLGILGVSCALAFAIRTRRVPTSCVHLAATAALWCPVAVTLLGIASTHNTVFSTLFIMEIACAGVLLHTRLLVGTMFVANAIALVLLVHLDAPYTSLLISCALTASVFALLIHMLMRRALLNAEAMRLELARSEASFRALVETSPDAMFVHGEAHADYAIRWVNPAMLRLLGHERPDDLVGKRSIDVFVHPDERARLTDFRGRVHRGEVPSGLDVRWVRRDGGVRHVHATSRRVQFGGIQAWLVVARDLTELVEHKRQQATAHDTIRESEERYRLLFDGSPLAKCVFDVETLRFVAVNDKMTELYGYAREELLAMRIADLKMPEDVGPMVDALAKSTVGDKRRIGVVRHRRKDGAFLEIDITAHQIEIGGRRCALAAAIDVTASRRVEEQLQQAQRMEAIGQLAGGVAHDFNNILAVILSNASLVAEELGDEHPLRAEILDIEAASNRAVGLTRQLLAFSRKQPRRLSEVALNSVVINLEKMLSRLVGEDIAMSASLAPQLGTVLADVGQLEQVLLNLVVNARDAMPAGGKLLLETANVDLDEAHAAQVGGRAGRHIMLSVTDSGCGMTAETRGRIFEPFFTTKPVGKGTGLGLSTVFGIVKQAEGCISVYSEVGRGTTFRVYLPRHDAAIVNDVAPAPARPTPRRGTETILVVEDDPLLRVVVRRQLQSFGYQLLEARDPEHALEVAAAFPGPIDLLLTDLVMPGMDGRSLASRLLTTRASTKVVFMSGYTEHAAVKTAAISPDDRFIEKPFTAISLSHIVREVLGAGTGAIQ
jgi:two-component system cell cycle sensor histidine kinase/response regulator CckA